jgi:N6-adenosine-specific RNA methylase IME4
MVYNSELENETLHTAHQSDLAPKNMVIFQFATLRLLRMTIHSMAPWGFKQHDG